MVNGQWESPQGSLHRERPQSREEITPTTNNETGLRHSPAQPCFLFKQRIIQIKRISYQQRITRIKRIYSNTRFVADPRPWE